MPNILELVEIAESLESKSIHVAQARCVAVRNRQSKCTKCIDACPTGAITVAKNKLSIDNSTCVDCGACTTVCPVEALVPLDPFDEQLIENIEKSIPEAQGIAVFACARMASKNIADTEKYAEVSCLARMEESVLLQLAVQGVEDIVLVDGVCATCKYRATNAGIDATVASANSLIAAQGSDIRITRVSEFPEETVSKDDAKAFGDSRRQFLSGAGNRAKDAATTTAEVLVFKKDKDKESSLREKLKMSDTGTLPQFVPERRSRILDAMFELGEPSVSEIDTRLFGSVSIDLDACNGCGMCTVFCVTGALKKNDPTAKKKDGLLLEFSAADCVQCRLCEDACIKSCLKLDSVVSLDELFDFEPRYIQLPPAPARKGILTGARR